MHYCMNDKFDERLVWVDTKTIWSFLDKAGLALVMAGSLMRLGVRADTLTVMNTLDKGAGTLRNAIAGAKNGDTIVFDSSPVGQTITIISDQLSIKHDL